ncbi:MAG: hypothetical protein ACRERD_30225, partial [Candidatus Binatia bacterium]
IPLGVSSPAALSGHLRIFRENQRAQATTLKQRLLDPRRTPELPRVRLALTPCSFFLKMEQCKS